MLSRWPLTLNIPYPRYEEPRQVTINTAMLIPPPADGSHVVLEKAPNIPEISRFVFSRVDPGFYQRAMRYQETGSIIVAGSNHGQGSSREHAAIAQRYLGVRGYCQELRAHPLKLTSVGCFYGNNTFSSSGVCSRTMSLVIAFALTMSR